MKSSHLQKRDDAVWCALDDTSHLSAREVGESIGESASLAHQALTRLEAEGRVVRSDVDGVPQTWSILPPPCDAKGEVVLTERDALAVAHLLQWLLVNGHAGTPTRAMLGRITDAIKAQE